MIEQGYIVLFMQWLMLLDLQALFLFVFLLNNNKDHL